MVVEIGNKDLVSAMMDLASCTTWEV